jgi:hypothetical protein
VVKAREALETATDRGDKPKAFGPASIGRCQNARGTLCRRPRIGLPMQKVKFLGADW